MPGQVLIGRYGRTLAALSVLFMILQVPFVWNGGRLGVFNSPDATANYHFARRLFEGKKMALQVPAVGPAGEYLFMRSSRILDGFEVPVGFVGMILISGFLSKLFFLDLIPYVTLAASAISVYLYFLLLRRLFPDRIAFLSAVLLMIHPAWWYYTNDTLFPNVVFMSAVLACLWFLINGAKRSDLKQVLTSGVLCGAAFLVRGIEFVWFLPLLVGSALAMRPSLRAKHVIVFFAGSVGIAVVAVVFLRMTTPLAFPFAYAVPPGAGSVSPETYSPFAVRPWLMLEVAWQYLARFFWPYTILAALGCIYVIRRKLSMNWILWCIGTAALGAVLLLLYGSWRIVDHPDPSAVTIGTSYVRYFLPLYLALIPLAAAALDGMLATGRRSTGRSIAAIMVIGLGLFLWFTAIAGSDESILAKRDTLKGYEELSSWITTNTPGEAIIVTDKSDKYVWPHRSVMTSYRSDGALTALRDLVSERRLPVFFVGPELGSEPPGLEEERLQAFGLSLEAPIHRNHAIAVYPFKSSDEN